MATYGARRVTGMLRNGPKPITELMEPALVFQ